MTGRDRIAVDGRPLPARERTRLFLYHKPRGLVTTHADPQGRPTIFEALPEGLPRLISVGRLDLNTEGLILLTNDGGLARVLELPQTGWLRRYRVRAHGEIMQPALDALRQGIAIDGIRYGPIEATLDRVQGSNVWLTVAIREGKNREVRNVLEHLGLQVNRLIRVSFGPFQLGDVPEGEVEEVKARVLREQLGERLIAAAGADFSVPEPARQAPQRGTRLPGSRGARSTEAGGGPERRARPDAQPHRPSREEAPSAAPHRPSDERAGKSPKGPANKRRRGPPDRGRSKGPRPHAPKARPR